MMKVRVHHTWAFLLRSRRSRSRSCGVGEGAGGGEVVGEGAVEGDVGVGAVVDLARKRLVA